MIPYDGQDEMSTSNVGNDHDVNKGYIPHEPFNMSSFGWPREIVHRSLATLKLLLENWPFITPGTDRRRAARTSSPLMYIPVHASNTTC